LHDRQIGRLFTAENSSHASTGSLLSNHEQIEGNDRVSMARRGIALPNSAAN
jgi:hypothetical protein